MILTIPQSERIIDCILKRLTENQSPWDAHFDESEVEVLKEILSEELTNLEL